MRLIILLLSLAFLTGCQSFSVEAAGSPQPPLPPKIEGPQQHRRLATWNVRNLFDDVNDPYKDETPNSEQYASKLDELARVLDQVDADFIALQEVENLESLNRLNSRLAKPYPQIGLLEGNDQIRGIDVAFMSRLEIDDVRSHAQLDLPKQEDGRNHHFSRDCLEVRLQTDPPVIVLVNHFKSGRGDSKSSAVKRRAQAEGVVQIATATDSPGTALFVMGDLNDTPDSWALEPLMKAFVDPFDGLPPEVRITHRYKKGGSALDHILLDDDARRIAESARVWSELARQTSDHNPVTIEVKVKAAETAAEKVWR